MLQTTSWHTEKNVICIKQDLDQDQDKGVAYTRGGGALEEEYHTAL